jgi:exonuclease VII large subunit
MMDRAICAVIKEADYGLLKHSPLRHREVLLSRIAHQGELAEKMSAGLKSSALQIINDETARIEMIKVSLEALSPRNIMKKGYGIIRDSGGKIITDANDVNVSDEIDIIMQNGELLTEVKEIRGEKDG